MINRIFVIAVASTLIVVSLRGGGQPADSVAVQLLAINDFHGSLAPPTGSDGRFGDTPAGGSEYLGTHLRRAIAANPNSIVVGAGDLIGASPLLSMLFHNEPTIESLDALQLALSSVGNHELDAGWQELLRLQRGGCHPIDGCRSGDRFNGARFQYLAANITRAGQSGPRPILPATAVRTIAGVKIGFIGETLRTAPRMVVPSGIRGLTFLDEASTANRYATELRKQGVNAIVLLIHQGGEQAASARLDANGCTDFQGELKGIVERLSADIRVVVSGHTHQAYNCTIRGHTVTSASSFGRMFTRLQLTIDRQTGTIVSVAARNEVVGRDVERDQAQSRIIEKYRPLAAPLADRAIGSVEMELSRMANRAGESALGDVIADAHLAATSAAANGGAVVAFTNPGGIRSDIVGIRPDAADARRTVTYAELFAAQPFANVMTVVTMTGDAIKRLLEQQFDNPEPGSTKVLQVSGGFTYRYALRAAAGQHVDAGSIMVNRAPVRRDARLRIAANHFLIEGGDGFTVFREGTNPKAGVIDVDAVVEYFRARSPIAPGSLNRIGRTD